MPDRGGDKGTAHSYIPVYKREIDRTTGVSLCEIGVYEGHSIAMWLEYLTDSLVLGLDINTDNLKFDVPVLTADATSPDQVRAAIGEQTFDYIIDDGSHRLRDQVSTLEIFWPRLNMGGKYFIEDIIGDGELNALREWFASRGILYKVHDGRRTMNRNDDLLLIAQRLQ